MTNTTNTAHANCTHARTKVDRARCRKARALAASRPAPTTYYLTLRANGSKVTHNGAYDAIGNYLFACTNKPAKVDVISNTHDAVPTVTCKNCVKNVTPVAYPA
jgi:hypothetical protein